MHSAGKSHRVFFDSFVILAGANLNNELITEKWQHPELAANSLQAKNSLSPFDIAPIEFVSPIITNFMVEMN